MTFKNTLLGFSLALSGLLIAPQARAADGSGADKQRSLIAVLQSDAKPGEKAIACKKLAIYGTAEAVPALAPLLADADLASWARIALEAIPGPAADEALRQAMDRLQGRLLVGTINSVGVRRDAKAVSQLAAKLEDADADVACAAAVALGKIGGEPAAEVLKQALAKAPEAVRSAVAEGCILCAERLLAEAGSVPEKAATATSLYDSVRQAKVPRQRVLEATRGAILARQLAGLPLLLEQIRSADKVQFGLGLRVARELPGSDVAKALSAELWQAAPERQPYLLLAIGDRPEVEALPTVLAAAKRGPKKLQLTAITIMDHLDPLATVPVLLETAAGGDAEVTAAALAALGRLPGNEVEFQVLSGLRQATGKMRQVLIELAGLARIERALPAVVRSIDDADAGIRSAAVRTLGILGEESQVAELARLLGKGGSEKDRADLEAALLAISSRKGASCVPRLLPLAQNSESSVRIVALHAFAAAGGPDALGAVKAAVEGPDEAVQDEAVRTLSTWPNTWPEDERVMEPLMALARSDKKTSHQVLALRGCLQFLSGDKKLKKEEKTSTLKELLPLIKRPEEKRQAIGVLHSMRSAGAVELLSALAGEPAVAEDAGTAIVDIAGRSAAGITNDQRRKALGTVVASSASEATKKKAQTALDRIQ